MWSVTNARTHLLALRRRRKQLLRKLPPLDAVLRGSLIERYKRCGNPGCKCADGPGHGPKYYLSVSYPGRSPQMDYVPQADYAAGQRALGQLSLRCARSWKRSPRSTTSCCVGESRSEAQR